MDRNELITIVKVMSFIAANATILMILYTIFIILFVAFLKSKISKIWDTCNALIIKAQHTSREFDEDLCSVSKHTHQIEKKHKKILEDIKVINKILSKYKGEMFDTKINNKISSEIAQNFNQNNKGYNDPTSGLFFSRYLLW